MLVLLDNPTMYCCDFIPLSNIVFSVEYIKVQHLYRILMLTAHVLLSFYVRIGAFDCFLCFVLVQVFRVLCSFL